ncbi:MAG: hypothetical protein V4608_10795 [Bacteroidota bacterium]
METITQKQIVQINPAEYGVEESKATQIAEQFKPMLDKMVELEVEYNEVLKLDIDDVMTPFKAKEVRLKYVKVRTGTAAIHKTQKDFYLQAGRFIDGWKNAQLFASNGIEAKLEEIEKHYENKEKARIATINSERIALLLPYDFDGSAMNLGTMEQNVWDNFLSGTKLNYEAKIAEEKRLELEAIEKQNAEIRERARIAEENAKLKAEAEANAKVMADQKARADAELAKVEALRKVEQEKADALLDLQRKQADEKAKKEKAITDAKLKAEREANEKLQAELRAKQDSEREAEAKKQAELKAIAVAEAKAKKAPDKEKLQKIVESFSFPTIPSMSVEAFAVATEIVTKFESFKKWANEQIQTL